MGLQLWWETRLMESLGCQVSACKYQINRAIKARVNHGVRRQSTGEHPS